MTVLDAAADPPPAPVEAVSIPAITDSVAHFISASRAASTLRAYQSDWEHFTDWCRSQGADHLPADPAVVAAYIADLTATMKVATIQRRLASIASAHKAAGHASPTSNEGVRLTLSGIRKTKGIAQRQVKPILLDDLRRLVTALPVDLRGTRDRALLLVGWAGAFRRSELVGIDVDDLEFTKEGLVVTVRRSKTDQEAAGRQVGIPYGTSKLCPVAALQGWLNASGVEDGPVFRRVNRHGHIGATRLEPSSVAAIVKEAAVGAGMEPSVYSGHSLRAGLATSAAMNGASEETIMSTTGHKSTAMVRRYIRRGNLFRQNAASLAGL